MSLWGSFKKSLSAIKQKYAKAVKSVSEQNDKNNLRQKHKFCSVCEVFPVIY